MTDARVWRMARLTALVAEDEPFLRGLVAGVIERLGVDVTCVTCGDEMLARIADHARFDVIVTDVAMPWMTGLHVMHSVRTAGMTSPVVVITALSDPRIPAQVASLGVHAVLLFKPFSLAALHHALAEATGHGVMHVPAVPPP